MIRLLPGRTKKLKDPFCAGVYFLCAGTREGKTLHTLALAHQLNANYLYVNEPRAVVEKAYQDWFNIDGFMTRSELFLNITKISNEIFCIDSVCDLFVTATKNSPAMKGGLTYDQLAFCKKLNILSYKNNNVLICVINRELVPSTSAFEGAVEGVIEIIEPSVLNFIGRENRKETIFNISKENMQLACDDLGFGKYISNENKKRELLTNTLSISKNSFRP